MLENLRLSHNAKCCLIDECQLSVLALFLFSGIFSVTVKAGGELSPYLDVSIVEDDNLYRLDSSVNVNDLASRISKSDTVIQAKAGVALDWRLSRQQLLADASVTDNRFEKNSNLDYTGQAIDLKWNWLFGSYFSGQVGWNQIQTLSDFSNRTTQESSKKEQRTANFLGRWRYASDWEVGVKLINYDLSYDLLALQTSDRKSFKKSIFWNYITQSGNRVGITLLREDGKYPNRVLNSLSVNDNEYQQDAILLNTVWQVTIKSKLSANVGWNARVHPNRTEQDYDGFNAKVAYVWFPSSQTVLNLDVYRQLQNSGYVDSTFSETSGYALGAVWRITEKLSFNGALKHEVRDYVGQNNGFKEYFDTVMAGMAYQPYSMLNMSLKLNQSARDSARSLRDYKSQSIVLGLSVKF